MQLTIYVRGFFLCSICSFVQVTSKVVIIDLLPLSLSLHNCFSGYIQRKTGSGEKSPFQKHSQTIRLPVTAKTGQAMLMHGRSRRSLWLEQKDLTQKTLPSLGGFHTPHHLLSLVHDLFSNPFESRTRQVITPRRSCSFPCTHPFTWMPSVPGCCSSLTVRVCAAFWPRPSCQVKLLPPARRGSW